MQNLKFTLMIMQSRYVLLLNSEEGKVNSLSWSTHIHDVIKKRIFYLYLCPQIKVYLSVDNRKRFYNAYNLPHFEHCCVV